MAETARVVHTTRLLLRPTPWESTSAIVAGKRLADWATDYPDGGDVVIANVLHRAGPPEPSTEGVLFGHCQVVERATGEVVGGIGFVGRLEGGEIEVGYGIVPSRQGRGYATEALVALVSLAWTEPTVGAVVAGAEVTNLASQRVLEKGGFLLAGTGEDGPTYRCVRPTPESIGPTSQA